MSGRDWLHNFVVNPTREQAGQAVEEILNLDSGITNLEGIRDGLLAEQEQLLAINERLYNQRNALREAIRNYLNERDNPAPDMTMRRIRRDELRQALEGGAA